MDRVRQSILLPLLHDGLPMIPIGFYRRHAHDAMPSIIQSQNARLVTGNYASLVRVKASDHPAISAFYARFILSD